MWNVSNKLQIYDNDVYVMGVTQKYIVINDNYQGIIAYEKDTSYFKNIFIEEELSVYQLHTFIGNDWIVAEDVEAEKLYICNLRTGETRKVFLNYVASRYYLVEGEYFSLSHNRSWYKYSYEKGMMVEEGEYSSENVILSNFQKEILYQDKVTNKIVYCRDGLKYTTPMEFDVGYLYGLCGERFIKYNEKCMQVYGQREKLFEYYPENGWEIRNVRQEEARIWVLQNMNGEARSMICEIIE